MKIVINEHYGGFSVNPVWLEASGRKQYDSQIRFDKQLINDIENNLYPRNDEYSADLCVVEFPDDATDWSIEEYDGCEWIIYVKDGKMHRVYPGENNEQDEQRER